MALYSYGLHSYGFVAGLGGTLLSWGGSASVLSCVSVDGVAVLRFGMDERCGTARHAVAAAAAAIVLLGYGGWICAVVRAVLVANNRRALYRRGSVFAHNYFGGHNYLGAITIWGP